MDVWSKTRKLEKAKADLAALELTLAGLAIENNNAQLSGISSIVETTEEAEKAKRDFQQAYLDRSVEIYNEDLKKQEEFNNQSAKAIEDANNRKIASYQKLADNIVSVMAPTFDFIGQSLVDQTFSWNGLANVAINSIGGIVSALGDQLAAEAAIQLVKGFMALASIVEAPLAPGYFASAALGAAGAAAAWAAGGALKAVKLADGGIVQPQNGGVSAMIAEAGQAEAVIPLDRLDSMLARAGSVGSDGGMMNLVVNLDSRPLLDKIFEATRNRTVLISSGAVV